MFLNGEVIDGRTLARYRRALQTWGRALTRDADILLYGCSVADTEKGWAFVNWLARYTGTDVAASTDRTGGTEDRWTLEYATGPVEAPALRMTGYPYYLATYAVSDGDYISVADGNWSAATGLCSPASATPDSGNNALIAASDTVTVDGADTINGLTVSEGGTLAVDANSLAASAAVAVTHSFSATVSSFSDFTGVEWAAPTTQARDITFSNVAQTQMKVTWTPENGTGVLVVAHQGSAVSSPPVDRTSYTGRRRVWRRK